MLEDIKIAYVKVADVKNYESNSRTHTEAQISKIAAAITEFGFLNPILLDDTFTLIAGHARVRAARKLGMDAVPAIFATHLTEAQRRAYVIADNRLSEDAGWDDAVLRRELHFLHDTGFNVRLTGMDDAALKRLVQMGDFAPTLNPETGSSIVNTAEMNRAQGRLDGQFDGAGNKDMIPLTCPHCGEDFSISREQAK